jgi:hypothetical protein
MTDLTSATIAKSDQLNSDDLFGRSITIKVTKVGMTSGEQPVSIHYEGDNGKPWKPCKSMVRVLVNCWGCDGKAYTGRNITLYRDDAVTWAGMAVGGIRISHLSHITKPITMSLSASNKSKKLFTVRPLAVEETPTIEAMMADIASAPTAEGLEHKFKAAYKAFPDARVEIVAAKDKRKGEL